jgi:DNA replication licensing factor MCM2
MRMSEAHAKMHLRAHVRDDDLDAAIRVLLTSFVSAQKFSVRTALRRQFRKYLVSDTTNTHLLLHILQDMFRKEQMYQTLRQRQNNIRPTDDVETILQVPLDELEGRARERKIFDVTAFCQSDAFTEAGYLLDPEHGMIVRA